MKIRFLDRLAIATLFFAFTVPIMGLAADSEGIEQFFGEYVGISVSDSEDLLSARDLDVTIHSHDNGFIMEWETVTVIDNDQVTRQKYKVKFHPTEIATIYAAAMRPDLFGGWIPLDPFKGDPFMWARVSGSILTAYAMLITNSGAHDMQIYKRTLTTDGLILEFQRSRNEATLGRVKGELKRVH
jgi:hypothetical protein